MNWLDAARKAVECAKQVTREDLQEAIDFYKDKDEDGVTIPTVAEAKFMRLGYEKETRKICIGGSTYIRYIKKSKDSDGSPMVEKVVFNLERKSYQAIGENYHDGYDMPMWYDWALEVDMELQKAINCQCQEFGWLPKTIEIGKLEKYNWE